MLMLILCWGCSLTAALASAADQQSPQYDLSPLRKDLESGLEYRRVIAVQLLGRVGTPEAVELMITTMLRDKSDAVRHAAQRELANREDARIFPAVQAAVHDPERRVRLAGIEALGLVRDPQAAEMLVAAIRAEPRDTDLTRLALDSLRTFAYHLEPAPGFEDALVFLLAHKDRQVRLATAAILGILARPGSLAPLQALWPQADTRLKIMLADAFGNICRAGPVPLLVETLAGSDKDLIIHSLYALSQIQAFSALGPIRGLLEKNPDSRIAIAALNALIEIPDPDNVPAVLAALNRDDASVRHWAAYALGELEAQAAIPVLAAKLKDPSSLVRATAVTALAELHAGGLEAEFLGLLNDPAQENDVRVAAAKALMRLGSKSGAGTFWNELQRKDLDLGSRLTYALALGALRDEKFTARLTERLSDSDFLNAFTAALALGTMGQAQARTPLVHALDHGNAAIRRYAILGLEGLRDPDSLKALADTASEDEDPLVRVLCASTLAATGHPEYRVLLWNALDNKDEDVRTEAVLALGRSADAEVLRQLKWYMRREPAVPVRENILRLLRKRAPQ
jgi:HEAT repeat protein